MPFTERRLHPRFPFHSRGNLRISGDIHDGTVIDVSLKGALFRTGFPLDAMTGACCDLEILRVGLPDFPIATARVAYHRQNLLGLEFLELTKESRLFLGEVMDMNLAVATLLERELPDLLGLPLQPSASR